MSAEVLRRAAAKMRERAQAATPGPWEGRGKATCYCTYCDEPLHRNGRCYGVEITTYMQRQILSGARGHDDQRAQADAEHVASWHPIVALAVADLLDLAADFGPVNEAHDPDCHECITVTRAEAVTRAYLGEQP